MKIKNVVLTNFKPYYGKCTIDLTTSEEKNIILIGGRNGQGKTSFLVGVVWCLYGKNISIVDDVFRNEVKNNYSRFLSKALNWTAKTNQQNHFSVEITFSDVALSEVFSQSQQKTVEIRVKRSFNITDLSSEKFEIFMDGEVNSLISDETDKSNFINDYIIPIDIAKFVFFDAEKIAEIAALDPKAQAIMMNNAFGQILGLNTYENLIEDFKSYEKDLQKQAAPHEINLEINTLESAKKANEFRLEQIEKQIDEIEDRVEELTIDINDLTNQLIKRGDRSVTFDIEALRATEKELKEKQTEVGNKFKDTSNTIALAMLAYKIEELQEHVQLEEELQRNEVGKSELTKKTKEFAEHLFNKPPFPEDDIDLAQKIFYYEKAKRLLAELENQNHDDIQLDFYHEMDRSDKNHIDFVYNHLQRLSQDTFEGVFNEYMRITNDYDEAVKQLRIAETSGQDEFIQEIKDKRNEAEREKDSLTIQKGGLLTEQDRLNQENISHQDKISRQLNKVKTSKEIEKKLKVAKKYIKSLEEFIKTQKEVKKNTLEKTLIKELSRLLTKKNLVKEVEINFIKLRENYGLEVKLYDDIGRVTNPATDMSKGEQQLYVSSLLSSILSESIHNLPVFIDTPLGRLDQEHRDNILMKYYPQLSEQVVIFSTNTEIRKSDVHKIEEHIATKYILKNQNKKTIIEQGYFV